MIRSISIFLLAASVLVSGPAWAGGGGPLDPARQSIEAGRFLEAAKTLGGVIDGGGLDRPTMARAHYLRGQAYEKMGWFGNAEQEYSRALWLETGNAEFRQALTRMRRRMAVGPH